MKNRLIITAVMAIFSTLAMLSGALGQQLNLGKHDTDQPIEISADSLEVLQDKNLAIFRGNVDVKQGKIRLQANELTVRYRQGGGGSSENVSGSIERIDAIGNVFMSTPTETAKGDKGSYDMASRVITLVGNVVLTRGNNVMRGQHLVYNMISGRSEMKGGGKNGRVKGLFVPEKKSK